MKRTFKGFVLNDFQEKAATAIEAGKSVLLSAPTGAGKTLVAEFAIQQSMAAGGRVIYTAPIKALSNQKYRDFRDDPEVDVGIMTGDVTINPGAPLVIMTTEILRNTIFEDPRRVANVTWVIFDEIHYMDDPDRGTVWEETIIFAPQQIKFICLSATVANLKSFGGWINEVREHELAVIHSDKRPVPLHHHLFHTDSGPFQLAKLDKAKHQITQAWRNKKKSRRPGGRRRISRHVTSAQLLDLAQNKDLLPMLYFCFSRKECEIKAEKNAKQRRLLSPREKETVATEFDRICNLYRIDWQEDMDLGNIRQRALQGIAFHHAGMIPIHKEVVERLFTTGLLKMLFTTETFALGINMPARSVAFNQLRKFDGTAVNYLMTRNYLQMAGRAGRQGIDQEGLVFSVLDTEDLFEAPLARILQGQVEPIVSRFNLSYSSILNLYANLGPNLVDAYEKSFAYYTIKGKSQKKRDKVRRTMVAAIVRKVHTLREAGYLEESGLLERGNIARTINGYEIQITEMLFHGVLDQLNLHQLNAVFAAIVYQERPGDSQLMPGRGFPIQLQEKVVDAVRRFQAVEKSHGSTGMIKSPEFSILPTVMAWSKGEDFSEIFRFTSMPPGDLVRTLRMTIQMLRNLRSSLTADYPLYDRLDEAMTCINRDVVDARKQLELG